MMYCRDTLRYCFMGVIQTELDRVAREWNCHRIRPSPAADVPGGIPDMLYFVPEASGLCIFWTVVNKVYSVGV